jgi:hypothetical protein
MGEGDDHDGDSECDKHGQGGHDDPGPESRIEVMASDLGCSQGGVLLW